MTYIITIIVFAVGAYIGFRIWGGAGIMFWFGICLSYVIAARLSTAGTATKIFLFALTGAALLLGGGSILANTVGLWSVVPWFVVCVVFLYRMRKRLFVYTR